MLLAQGIDGFFDFYPTKTVADLELRLSEMFHLGRAAYILAEPLRSKVVPLLDRIDASAQKESPDTVINERGVLVGYALGHRPEAEQLAFWTTQSGDILSD